MSKLYLQHDYKVTGRDYVETDGGDTPAGGISYSTEEQNTGLKWIDGKDIYQCTLEVTSEEIAAHECGSDVLASCDQIIDISGFYFTSNNTIALNCYESGAYFARCSYRVVNKNLALYVTGYTVTGGVITVKYTKTE